jgi:uncharacterized protein YdaU (DUF1376 family)
MAKDPAFLFYSSDFLSGIADLTMEERGQYITLLCLQHQKGNLTEKTIKIAVPNISTDVLSKFIKDEDGNYFNKRLSEEILKRKTHSERQRENVLKRWNKTNDGNTNEDTNNIPNKYDGNTMVIPLENENEDVNINDIENYKLNIEYNVEENFNFYLQNNDIIKAFIENGENNIKDKDFLITRLKEFNVKISEVGDNKKTFLEYCSHFRNWNLKNPPKEKLKMNENIAHKFNPIA